jgi:superfamily II DNA or RNA helicase
LNKIIVKHSSILITNYNLGDCPKLEYFFTIYDRTYHDNFYKAIKYDEENKTLTIPRGVDVFWLENLFQCQAVMDYKHDEFDSIPPVKIKYLPRDDVQKEALRFMLAEGEYKHNRDKSQISVNLNTGAGKTYVTIASIAYTELKSMIITCSLDWLNQWKKCILEYTDIQVNEIYFISGTSSILRLLNRKDMGKYKIFLASHNTIKSYGDSYGWDKVGELFKYLKIAMKVYDEAHLNFDNMCNIDFATNTYKTIYLTATPARSDKDENVVYKLYFKNIPSIDLFDEENDPRTAYMAFHYNSHPTILDAKNCKNQYGLDRNRYTNYVVEQENFGNMLHIVINIIKKTQAKALIYIGTNAAINVVKAWIEDNYPELRTKIGVYTSQTTVNKEKEKDKKIILSTTKSCGAAMDIKGLKITVVLAEPFKSEVLARQTLGRTRDKDTYYIEMVDEGFRYTKKYYQEKKEIFAKYATTCTDTYFDDIDIRNKMAKLEEKRNNTIFPLVFYKENELRKVITKV